MRSTRTWLWVLVSVALAFFAYRTWQSSHVGGETIDVDEGYGTNLAISVAYETSFLVQAGLIWLASVLIAGYAGFRLAKRQA